MALRHFLLTVVVVFCHGLSKHCRLCKSLN